MLPVTLPVIPPLNVRFVDVEFEGNGYEKFAKDDGEYPCHVPAKLLEAFVKRLTPEKVLALLRRVEEAAVRTILLVPSKDTLLIVRAVASFVAVSALPVKLPVRPPLNVIFVDVALDGNG